MRAIILAGGYGTRLQPYTRILPKPLIPLENIPILQIILLQLRRAGITGVTLALCYKARQIMDYFKDGAWLGLKIDYYVEAELRGTAGPLSRLQIFNEPCIVLNSDILTSVNFADIYRDHQQNGAIATIVVYQHSIQIPYGVVETDRQRVLAIAEKPHYIYQINTGIYVLDPLVREQIIPDQRQDMPDLLHRLLQQGYRVHSYPFRGNWTDIGTVEQFRQAQELFRRHRDLYLPEQERPPALQQEIEISQLEMRKSFPQAGDDSQLPLRWR